MWYLTLWWSYQDCELVPQPSHQAHDGGRSCGNYPAVMESRDLVSVSKHVSRPVFSSLGLGLEGLRSRLGLGLEGFWSRSRALNLETLHELFFV